MLVEQERVNRLQEKAQALENALSRVRVTSRALGSEAGPPRLNLSPASGLELIEKTLEVGRIRKSINDKTVPRLVTHLQEVRRSQTQYYLGELQRLSEEGHLTSREKRLADEIKARFGEEEPIFYSKDPRLRELLGVSRYTLSEILQIAQRSGVIPIPMRGGHGKRVFYYSRSEILEALDYFFQLRQEGQGLFPTAKTLRQKEMTGQKLTLKEAAQRLGVKLVFLQRAIVEGRFNLGSAQAFESVRRIKNPHNSKARLIDPTLLTLELVEKLNKAKEIPFSITLYRFQRNRASFSTVSDVFREAHGTLPPSRHVAEIAQLLIGNGVKVSYLTSKGLRGGYWVLAREDQEAAVRILQDNPTDWRLNRSSKD